MPSLPPPIQRLLQTAALPVYRNGLLVGVIGLLSLLALRAVLPHSISFQDAQWLQEGMERDSIERHFGPPATRTAYEDIYNLDDGRRVRIRYQAEHADAITLPPADSNENGVEVNLHGRTFFGGR